MENDLKIEVASSTQDRHSSTPSENVTSMPTRQRAVQALVELILLLLLITIIIIL